MTPKPQANTLDEKIMEAIRDGLANHTGEWLNGFVTKDNYTVEQSTQLLNDICGAKRLNNNIQALITEARIDELESMKVKRPHNSGEEIYISFKGKSRKLRLKQLKENK